jgi:Flp pilus assembly protein TadD
MRRAWVVAGALIMMSGTAWGQAGDADYKAAMDRLAAKQRERNAAAASQPATPAAPSTQPVATAVEPEEVLTLMAGDPVAAVKRLSPAFRAGATDPLLCHALAVSYIRAGQLQPARAPMDRAYEKTKDPSRSLILNRAMLDVGQRSFAARAMKDLKTYLLGSTG